MTMTASARPGDVPDGAGAAAAPTASVALRRTEVLLEPGGDRVLGRPHVPGDDPASTAMSRVERIARGVLALTAAEVAAELDAKRAIEQGTRVAAGL